MDGFDRLKAQKDQLVNREHRRGFDKGRKAGLEEARG